MNIAIIGVGGVGGYFGGKLTRLLAHDSQLNIYFIARNQHLAEIQRNGLILDSDEGILVCKPTLATDDISELPLLDLCLICVKSYDLDEVLIRLVPKVSDSTMVLPLLNGVDIYERIRFRIHNGIVFPSCVYVATHIEKAGKVVQTGRGANTILLGNDPEKKSVCPALFELFDKARITYEWFENPYSEIWCKFIFIASLGLVTANYSKTVGEVLLSQGPRNDVENIMKEIVKIAKKKKKGLPPTIIPDSLEKAHNLCFETKTSFQRDFEIKERPDERDLFGGTIVRLGKQYGISTEATRKIFDSLQKQKPLEKNKMKENL